MENKSFSTTIQVKRPPQEVFNCLTAVTKWWSNDFEGSSSQLHDEFTIHHPGQHYSRQRLTEMLPAKKIVWSVTDSTLYWLQNNKHEWTGTKMIFEITATGDETMLHFTHDGLTPRKECYAMCEKGWTMIIKEWLFHFIIYGSPSPEMDKAAAIRDQFLADNANATES